MPQIQLLILALYKSIYLLLTSQKLNKQLRTDPARNSQLQSNKNVGQSTHNSNIHTCDTILLTAHVIRTFHRQSPESLRRQELLLAAAAAAQQHHVALQCTKRHYFRLVTEMTAYEVMTSICFNVFSCWNLIKNSSPTSVSAKFIFRTRNFHSRQTRDEKPAPENGVNLWHRLLQLSSWVVG